MSTIVQRLAERGVTPAQALVDIERSPDYMTIIASDDGQALIAYLARQDAIARGQRLREKEDDEDDDED